MSSDLCQSVTFENMKKQPDFEYPSLLLLNDDCLEHVLRQLDTKQQHQLAKLHARLHRLVHEVIWRHYLKSATITQSNFEHCTDDEFLDFIFAISPYVQTLNLLHLERTRFQLLAQCVFPRVHTMHCVSPFELHRDALQRYADEDVLMLQQSFPNMETLSVKAFSITCGKYLFAMKNLIKLQLNFL